MLIFIAIVIRFCDRVDLDVSFKMWYEIAFITA